MAEEVRTGHLATDLVISLYRVSLGFLLAVVVGVPIGLWMGQKALARAAFLPIVNFFRAGVHPQPREGRRAARPDEHVEIACHRQGGSTQPGPR